MENQEALDILRNGFASVLTEKKKEVIVLLNENGFPTFSSIGGNDLIESSLKAYQLSNNFRDKLIDLMAETSYAKSLQKKNFAAQPAGGGFINILNGNSLFSNITNNNQDFIDFPIFN